MLTYNFVSLLFYSLLSNGNLLLFIHSSCLIMNAFQSEINAKAISLTHLDPFVMDSST